MSRIFSPNLICERALRICGRFPLAESAADGEAMREAMFWLDMIMAELVATSLLLSLVNARVPLVLEPGVARYRVRAIPGAVEQYGGSIQFPLSAHIEGIDGRHDSEVTIVSLDTWREVTNGSVIREGTPTVMWMDRGNDPYIHVHPVPPLNELPPQPRTLVMSVLSFADDLSPGGTSGDRPNSSTAITQVSVAWQRYLVYALAADLGRGAIAPIAPHRVQGFREEAMIARRQLEAVQNRQWDNELPIMRPYNMSDYMPYSGYGNRDYGRKLR